MKQTVAKTIAHWDSILVKLSNKKRDDRQKAKQFPNDPIEHVSTRISVILTAIPLPFQLFSSSNFNFDGPSKNVPSLERLVYEILKL